MKAIYFQKKEIKEPCFTLRNGRKQKQVFNRISKRNLELQEKIVQTHEREGRLTVKKFKGPFRVKTPSTNISEYLSDQRKTRNRSFCSRLSAQLSQ